MFVAPRRGAKAKGVEANNMSHKARRITKCAVILSVVIGGLAFCHFGYTAFMKDICYDDEIQHPIETQYCQDVWWGGDEILQVDATIAVVASVFLIGSIVISLRRRRNRLGADLDYKIGAAIESFGDWYSHEAHLREQSANHRTPTAPLESH